MLLRNSRSAYIEIDLLRRQLHFYQGSRLVSTYPIAIGKPSTPSPIGNWHVVNKKILTYPSVFGTRWMGLNNPGYGIHGTNNPSSIGTAASLGCIRMHNHHVEELFPLVSIGTPVTVHKGSKAPLNLATEPKVEPRIRPTVTPEEPVNPSVRTYTVKPGDTFWDIAKRLNIPLNQLVKANLNLNPNNLQIGQIINLPLD